MRHNVFLLAAIAALASLLLPAAVAVAAPATLTGTVVTKEKVALSPGAEVVVTLVDQQAGPQAGAIIGQQRIEGAQLPATFAIPYDDAAINPAHSYALFASVIDGTNVLQSFEAVPVITGGPTTDVTVSVRSSVGTGTLTGTITRADRSALTGDAIAYAVLLKADTGTLIARQVIPGPPSGPIPFAITGDPGLLDPAATYVVQAAIVDGETYWRSEDAIPAIKGGELVTEITVPVTLVAAAPAPTPEPTVAPTQEPTEDPTPEPTEEQTEAPTAEPAATPTATPTAAPTATPAPTASPTVPASASSSPTASPDTGTIRGTLTYYEDHELSGEARAVVLLVEGSAGPQSGNIVASTVIDGPSEPVPFELAYPWSAIRDDATYRLYAGIADGELAWVTPIGVAVDVPQPAISGVELPLLFRPDLLKAAVTGTITGVGLDPARDPNAYGTALIIRVDTGETIGFQLISPTGAVPVPFSVPYDPDGVVAEADYVVRGSIWDGTQLWTTDVGTPVITKSNARNDLVLTVTAVPVRTPAPAPTPAPSADVTAPAADAGSSTLWIVLALIGVVAVVGLLAGRRRAATRS